MICVVFVLCVCVVFVLCLCCVLCCVCVVFVLCVVLCLCCVHLFIVFQTSTTHHTPTTTHTTTHHRKSQSTRNQPSFTPHSTHTNRNTIMGGAAHPTKKNLVARTNHIILNMPLRIRLKTSFLILDVVMRRLLKTFSNATGDGSTLYLFNRSP